MTTVKGRRGQRDERLPRCVQPLRQGDRKEEERRGEADDHEVREPFDGERGEHARDRGTVGGAQQAGARQVELRRTPRALGYSVDGCEDCPGWSCR